MLSPFQYLINALDIIIVAIIFYRVLLLLRGTRAIEVVIGMVILIAGSFITKWLKLDALSWLISSIKTIWLVAFVIVFQPELRRALAQLGSTPFARYFLKPEPITLLDDIVKATTKLSARGIGALIVLGREISLKNYIQTGEKIQAKVTTNLINTIFVPTTPLHDGAIIIRGDTIIAAGCILPLTERDDIPSQLGTRHRAAIGLSEQTDALVIIVSEETRSISLAKEGKLEYNITPDKLRNILTLAFSPTTSSSKLDETDAES